GAAHRGDRNSTTRVDAPLSSHEECVFVGLYQETSCISFPCWVHSCPSLRARRSTARQLRSIYPRAATSAVRSPTVRPERRWLAARSEYFRPAVSSRLPLRTRSAATWSTTFRRQRIASRSVIWDIAP